MRAVAPELIRLPEGPAPIREVFIVLPGLNFHPDRLEPWEARFAAHGAATVRPALRGHTTPADPAWGTVTAEQWLEDVGEAYLRLAQRFPGAKLSLFGFSLGGVLGLTWSRRHKIPFHRAVLLAPALASKPWPWVGLILCSLLPGRLKIRSVAPRSYRLHDSSSMAAYQSVRALVREFQQTAGEEPSALFAAMSPKDELVSPEAVARYVETVAAGRTPGVARLHSIEHQPRPGWLYHLGVDAFTLGDAAWGRLDRDLEDWLAVTAP